MENVSVFFTNIRSVIKKRDELCSALDSASADIIVLTETWLSSKIRNDELFFVISSTKFIGMIGIRGRAEACWLQLLITLSHPILT